MNANPYRSPETDANPSVERSNLLSLPDDFLWILRTIGAGEFGTTAIQLPLYAGWILVSRELTAKQKLIWLLVLTLLNMMAIPLFLHAKYHRGTVSMLRSGRN